MDDQKTGEGAMAVDHLPPRSSLDERIGDRDLLILAERRFKIACECIDTSRLSDARTHFEDACFYFERAFARTTAKREDFWKELSLRSG